MDTSETYIKMCEKVEEIQLLRREEHNMNTRKWQPGDFWCHIGLRPDNFVFIVPDVKDAWDNIPEYIHHPRECIWLPRQDQLQEMIDWEGKYNLVFVGSPQNIGLRVNKLTSYYDLRFSSMEQLWIAFMMKENYNKIWNGEDWVKEIE